MTLTPNSKDDKDELKKQTPQLNGVGSEDTQGYPDSPILLQFKHLKKLRNNHLIDEPEFDIAVIAIFEAYSHKLVLEGKIEELKHLDRHNIWYPDGSEPIEVQKRIAELEQELKEVK